MASSGVLAALCCAALVELVASVLFEEDPPSCDQSSPDPIPIISKAFGKFGVPPRMPKDAEIAWTGRKWSPTGWVHHRTPGQQAFFDIHIPKTAGCSWSIEVKKVLAPGAGYYSRESCYYTPVPMNAGDMKVVFMRDPVMHVYSQYLECKYDGWGRSVVPGMDKPKMKSVTTWLRHFEGGAQRYDLGCYHPYNMQARAMVCSSRGAHHYLQLKDGLQEALSNLDSVGFVGIVEHYQASLCLFAAKTRPGHPLPEFCDCTDKQAWATLPHTHETHGVPPHSISNLTQEDRSMIAELTKIDRPLYEHALERFRREADEVARTTGTKILC